MPVCHKLPRLASRSTKPQTIHDVIKSALQENQQLCTGNSLLPSCTAERVAELTLKESVRPLNFLLLAQLNLEVRELLTSTTMLAWATLSLLYCTLSCVTPLTFEEELLPLSATQATN
jgi:hypothetical protein